MISSPIRTQSHNGVTHNYSGTRDLWLIHATYSYTKPVKWYIRTTGNIMERNIFYGYRLDMVIYDDIYREQVRFP